jgi:carbamoyl-phosphate synthase large subunit
MGQTTVLLTGAGGATTPLLIRHLRGLGFRVIAADMDRRAAGLLVADKAYEIPGGATPEFQPHLREICDREGVRAIVPLVDEELVSACELDDGVTTVLAPRRDFVVTCLDKQILMQRLASAGIGVPWTRLGSEGADGINYPVVVKPRTGRGSRGLAFADSPDELRAALDGSDYEPGQLLIQESVQGPEFTVSVVSWRDGEVQAVVPKEVIVKRGITRLAVTRRNAAIEQACRDIQARLRADGPFNVQLRIDARSGIPKVFEINPRYSTTVSLTLASGIDEVGGLLRQALGGRSTHVFGDWKEGVVLNRSYLDEFLDEGQYLERTGRIVLRD